MSRRGGYFYFPPNNRQPTTQRFFRGSKGDKRGKVEEGRDAAKLDIDNQLTPARARKTKNLKMVLYFPLSSVLVCQSLGIR